MSLDRMSCRTERYCEGMFAIYIHFSNFILSDLHQRRSGQFSRWLSFVSLQFYNSYASSHYYCTKTYRHTISFGTVLYVSLHVMAHAQLFSEIVFMRHRGTWICVLLNGMVFKQYCYSPNLFVKIPDQVRNVYFEDFWLCRLCPVKPSNLHPWGINMEPKKSAVS